MKSMYLACTYCKRGLWWLPCGYQRLPRLSWTTTKRRTFPDPTITLISPNLTPGGEPGLWTQDEFIKTIRTGMTPSGHELDTKHMPWDVYKLMTDDELKAIYMYLQSAPKLQQYTQ